MSEAKKINVFDVVNFPRSITERDALKEKFAAENYSCSKEFTLKEVVAMFPSKQVTELLNYFSSFITDDLRKELLVYIGSTVKDFMERSFMHTEFSNQYQLVQALLDGSVTEKDVTAISYNINKRFADCSSHKFSNDVDKNIQKTISVLIGLYSKENTLFTVKVAENLLFGSHTHNFPLYQRLSKDARAFAKGEMIDIKTYYQDIYSIVTK